MSEPEMVPRLAIVMRCALACALGAAATACMADDLLDVYARARSTDPMLLQAAALRAAAQEQVVQARAPLLPQLGATVGWSQLQRANAGTAAELGLPARTRSRDPALNLSQTLIDLARLATVQVNAAQAASQDASYRAAAQALPVRVATAYFNVLESADMLVYVQLASFWVTQRRRQIGIRRALGATRGDILRYFQIENFAIVSLGILFGMLIAYGLNLGLMRMYELPRLPIWYMPIGALALWILRQLAVLVPALQASAISPVAAIRTV